MQSRTGVKLLWIKVEGNSTSDPVCVVSLAIVSSRNAIPVEERLLFTRIRTNLWTDEFLCKFRDRLQHCWPFKNLHGSLGSRIFARFCLFKILCGPVKTPRGLKVFAFCFSSLTCSYFVSKVGGLYFAIMSNNNTIESTNWFLSVSRLCFQPKEVTSNLDACWTFRWQLSLKTVLDVSQTK